MILMVGLWSLLGINRSEYPKIELGLMVIKTYYPGASPEDVELNITNKIEDKLKNIVGIEEIRSTSSEGISLIIVEMEADVADIESVKDDIREAVGNVSDLPKEVREQPVITERKTSIVAVIEVGLASELPYKDVREIARRFEKKLKALPGVAEVRRFGFRPREIKIEVSPQKLREYQVSMGNIIQAIQSRNIRDTGGSLESYTSEKNVVTLSHFRSPYEVGEVIVRSTFEGPQIKVRDLARINDSFAEPRILSRVNGKPAISFRLSKTENADIVRTTGAIKALVEQEKQIVGDKIEFLFTDDLSKNILNSFEIVRYNGSVGLVLVIIVLALFLNLRTAFWVALGIPIALLGVIFMLPNFGVDLNRVTLMSMILVIGIIVDDAIIVSENIYRRRELGDSPIDAVVNGLNEVFLPVLTTIFTTFLAFAPLFFMPGILGKAFYVIPLTISLALIMSLLEAVMILPAHLLPGLRAYSPEKVKKWDWFASIRNVFEKAAFYMLKLRYVCVLLLFLFFFGAIFFAYKYMDFVLVSHKRC